MNKVPKPPWLRKKIQPGQNSPMKKLLAGLKLDTICEQALCPNITECFHRKQATFLILGSVCTRNCAFCNVDGGQPLPPDSGEPDRVAEAVRRLSLRHVVITSPTRDDLPDGGAEHFARTVLAVKQLNSLTTVEVLIPDFRGDKQALETVLGAAPHILGHNLETVPRLYSARSGADYRRSLELLARSRRLAPAIPAKSGLMLGLGETVEEVHEVMNDLIKADCRMLSVGQYLAPRSVNLPVAEYVPPEIFQRLKDTALGMGFSHVESGPYVRSSYLAKRYLTEEETDEKM